MIGNVSLWETIPRSLATTFITLLPIVSLLVFGGDTLKDFAFALLVGIGSGAYSSIFIAAPLLAMFKEREPEYARRRDDEGAVGEIQSVGGALLPTTSPSWRAPSPLAAPAPVAPARPPRRPACPRRRRAVRRARAPAAAALGPAARPSALSGRRSGPDAGLEPA